MPTHPQMSTRRFAAGLVALAAVAGLAWLAALAVVAPVVLGWRSVVVTSGSMEPALHRGDVVLAPKYEGKPLEAGTVVVFNDGDRGLLTHRILSRSEDGTYVTRGDNNTVADSTPLRPEQIEATGRAMVPRVGIVSVLAQEGRWAALAALAAAVGGIGVIARWGIRGRPRRAAASVVPPAWTVPQAAHARRVPAVVGAAVAVQLVVALAALPGAKAAWAAPTSNGESTLGAAASWQQWYLDTPVEGSSSASQAFLPLGTVKPSYAGAVPNYDTDRDADPGLTLAPSVLGLAETDPAKSQVWFVPPTPGAKQFTGSVRLRLPTAVRDFDPTARGRMIAGLYLCDPGPSGCTLQASATVDRPDGWAGSLTTFVNTAFDFGAVDFHMPGNKDIAVKVVVDAAGSDDSMWLAYDTVAWPAAVQLS